MAFCDVTPCTLAVLVPVVYRYLLSPSSGHKKNPEGEGKSCSKISELSYQTTRRHVLGDTAVIA